MSDLLLSILSLLGGGFLTAAGMLSINRKKGKEEVLSSKILNFEKILEVYDSKIIKPLEKQIQELTEQNERTRNAISSISTCVNRVDCPVLGKLFGKEESNQ